MATETTRLPVSACPHCQARVDAADTFHGTGAPEPGDVTVCLYCARLCEFGEDMNLRAPSAERTAELMADPGVRRAVSVVQRYGPRDPGRRRLAARPTDPTPAPEPED